MDRNKTITPSRTQKKMAPHTSNEFFALGTKGGRDDNKSKVITAKGSVSSSDRKRESSSHMHAISKKLKTCTSVKSEGTLLPFEPWQQMAVDCEPVELVKIVITSGSQLNNDSCKRALCGSFKQLSTSSTRTKPDHIISLALLYVSKIRPHTIRSELVTAGLLSLLRKREIRQNACIQIIASNALARGFDEVDNWPESFMRSYIDDAVNDRFWIDNIYCQNFVYNIVSCFKTRVLPNTFLQSESFLGPSNAFSHARENLTIVDDDSGDTEVGFASRSWESENYYNLLIKNKNRFQHILSQIEHQIVETIKDLFNKKQHQDSSTRNILKFLCTAAGIAEVRYIAISRLELWVHNGKLVKLAQKLLAYICFNINADCIKDQEVLTYIIKMRLKAKQLIQFYLVCLKEMIIAQPNILRLVLKLVVQNELSNARNPNNMGMLATMFQTSQSQSASCLAEIYKELLLQRDDCLRTLRVFLRELVRLLRYDVDLVQFVKVFLNERSNFLDQVEQSDLVERIFHSMVDITCLCMLLLVSPQVREASISLRTIKDDKSNIALLKFSGQMSQMQLEAVSWMYETVPIVFKLESLDYSHALHKILLLENPEQYSRSDQWPSEPDRTTLLRLASETPVHEETLLRVILIGITKDIPFSIPDTVDIIMLVIKRASAMRLSGVSAIKTTKFDIIDFLFSMTEYHHPENIKLPKNYDPPKLAITVLYWKAWLIMLMISAHNPSTFGAFCWNQYPMMKMLIEMCITNQFDDIGSKDELQMATMERNHILELETYLAAQTSQAIITEENAILISQLMLLDPMGPSRRVPSGVLEQLKFLNKTLKLGHLLCRSRKPDMLLEIVQMHGTTQSMPWLSDLVQNSEGDLSHLPVQCLCEFLLFNANVIKEDNSRDAELINFLRNLLSSSETNDPIVCEILDYILRRLSSTVKQSRIAALSGIKILFGKTDADIKDSDWWLRAIAQIPNFKEIRSFIIPQIRAACQVENSPELVMSYIQFIASHTLDDSVVDMLDHVIDMAQLIVERSTLFQCITPTFGKHVLLENRFQTLKCLFVMFNNYVIKLREHQEPYEWTEYPDLLMVRFDDGVQLPLHLNIVHAFIILLTHANNSMPESIPILNHWFPQNRPAPTAFFPNMPQEPVQILPDWLKLKMIRSSVNRLIEAALRELAPDQIVLFVQNFGTPINSMSKLLALLDHAVIEQFNCVKTAILNKAYLAQLIEIQQTRGAKNGHLTVQALGLHSHSQTVPDFLKPKNYELKKLKLKKIKKLQVTSKKSQNLKKFWKYNSDILQEYEISENCFLSYRKLIYTLWKEISFVKIDERERNNTSFNSNLEFIFALLKETSKIVHIFFILRAFLKCYNFFEKNHNEILVLEEIHKNCNELVRNASRNNGVNEKIFIFTINVLLSSKKTLDLSKKTSFYSKDVSFVKMLLAISKPILLKNNTELKLSLALETTDKIELNKFFGKLLKCKGLLVDWLTVADPETTAINLILQQSFFFSSSCHDFRFYLLSLLCHQTNWVTLVYVLKFLLKKFRAELDPSTILNFTEAVLNNPKLWQGRDKYVSKSVRPEIILVLTEKERNVLMEFILNENLTENFRDIENHSYKLCSRIKLLFEIVSYQSNEVDNFVESILKSSSSDVIILQTLQQIYLMFPSIKFVQCCRFDELSSKYQQLKGCSADKVNNYLITCLGSLFSKKDYEAVASDTELLLRKLAASHPGLFLRQLGVLSSLIEGRAYMSTRALREEFHFHRFIQIIRTLELLQPYMFDDAYKQDLQAIMVSYLMFLKHHSNAKEAYHILIKFVELLQNYININPTSALSFIDNYVDILMELGKKFQSLAALNKLVQGIALLQHKAINSRELSDESCKQEFDTDEVTLTKSSFIQSVESDISDNGVNTAVLPTDINSRGTFSFAISNSYQRSNISPHFLNLIKIVKNSSIEDAILSPLQEIESLTSKRFFFLNELFDRLLELIFSHSAQIRSNAFILLIRHLKHNPGQSDLNRSTLNAYIQCLRDDNSSVAATAVDNLPDITILLQEHAFKILAVAFSLGIKSRLNTCIQIKRVIQTITLQYGF